MLKNILNLSEVSVISKNEQVSIQGGFGPFGECHIQAPCAPNEVFYMCSCHARGEV